MKRQDLYIIGLTIFQIFFFLHAMSVVNTGAGLSLLAEQGIVGYLSIALFAALFIIIFMNIANLMRSIALSDDEALKAVSRAGRLSIAGLIVLAAIQFFNALALYVQYYAGA